MTSVYRIPQVDGAVRLVALTEADYEIVRDNPPMIEAVRPLAVADVYPGGKVEWELRRSSRGVAAIEEALAADEDEEGME